MGELERNNKENFKKSNYQNKNDLTSEKSIRENTYNGKGLLKPKSNRLFCNKYNSFTRTSKRINGSLL